MTDERRGATRERRRKAPEGAQPDRAGTILNAALAVFAEKGFAAARVEDVAARAGIAKGTVYLYFESKEALFKGLVRSMAAHPLGRIGMLAASHDGTTEDLLRAVFGVIRREILETDRRFIVRLILTEAHRFPEIAAFYYDEVVSQAIGLFRAIVERGIGRGEVNNDTLIRFPQLVVAPFLTAVLWQGLFDRAAPLDVEGLFQAHLNILFTALRSDGS